MQQGEWEQTTGFLAGSLSWGQAGFLYGVRIQCAQGVFEGWHRCFPTPLVLRAEGMHNILLLLLIPCFSSRLFTSGSMVFLKSLSIFFKKIFIYLFVYLAPLDLSCIMQDLLYVMPDISQQRSDSLAVVHGFNCSMTHGILVPQPGIEFSAPALQGVFSRAGPPGKSPDLFISCCPWFAPTLHAHSYF